MAADMIKDISIRHTFNSFKETLSNIYQLFHFDHNRITASFIHKDTGMPITGLSTSNFTATAVQTPSSWVADESLDIINVSYKGNGIYAFLLNHNGKKLLPGKWTIVIKVIKSQETIKVIENEIVNFTLL